MFNTIKITGINKIILKTPNKETAQLWQKMFSSIDEFRASKHLFSNTVNIAYNHDTESQQKIELQAVKNFLYEDVEAMLYKMYKINNLINYITYSKATLQAFDCLPSNFSLIVTKKLPNYMVSYNNNKITIKQIFQKEKKYKEFINKIKENIKNLPNIKIKEENETTEITGLIEISDHNKLLSETIINTMSQNLEQTTEIKEHILSIALKNFSYYELKSLNIINNYPNNHPLHQYKKACLEAINIFTQIFNNGSIQMLDKNATKLLKSAILKEGLFSDCPPIINKSFIKLRNRFIAEINEYIINVNYH